MLTRVRIGGPSASVRVALHPAQAVRPPGCGVSAAAWCERRVGCGAPGCGGEVGCGSGGGPGDRVAGAGPGGDLGRAGGEGHGLAVGPVVISQEERVGRGCGRDQDSASSGPARPRPAAAVGARRGARPGDRSGRPLGRVAQVRAVQGWNLVPGPARAGAFPMSRRYAAATSTPASRPKAQAMARAVAATPRVCANRRPAGERPGQQAAGDHLGLSWFGHARTVIRSAQDAHPPGGTSPRRPSSRPDVPGRPGSLPPRTDDRRHSR